MKDFKLVNCQSILVLHPLSEAAQEWVDENPLNDETVISDGGVCIGWRYIYDSINAIKNDGLTFLKKGGRR